MYNGSEHMITETYMIPGTNSDQQLVLTPTFPEVGSMGSEVAPEFLVDQGLYYSTAAPNYYGYYCTGFESPGESDDRHRFFGLDGQDLHGSEMQTENLPYVYYTPSYGYAQSPYSPYNPYNPYIPGAVIGVDSPFVGTQQYITNVAYQQPISSPGYFPVVVHSGADIIPTVAPEPLVYNAVGPGPGASGIDTLSVKFAPPASVAVASTMQQSDSVSLGPVLPHSPVQLHPPEVWKLSQVDVMRKHQPALDGAIVSGGIPHVMQGRDPVGSVQVPEQHKAENVSSVPSSSKVSVLTYNASTDFEPSMHGRAIMEGVRPRFSSNGNVSPNMLSEQNRGPRVGRSKGPCASLVVKGYTTKAGVCDAQGNITIYLDQYNRENFPVNYPDAKFFVIKSYSEDDVHKSIKYNIWSSTPSGNKRLDSAYEDAQRISGGDTRKCPIFLFFSVNASGQFCGVAEMTGPVDFNRDMDFWQQDKWTGSFPVKWHIIKDVPNTSFRHIILENNENKPVTNSRDTQEIKYMPGMSMLTIFKNSPLKTSILDDFMYYEERQRIMHEEKSRLLRRSYNSTLFFPPFTPPSRSTVTIKHPLKAEEKLTEPYDTSRSSDVTAFVDDKTNSKQTEPHDKMKSSGATAFTDGKTSSKQVESYDNIKSSDVAASIEEKMCSKLEHAGEANNGRPATSGVAQGAEALGPAMKISSLSLDSERGETSKSSTATLFSDMAEYVTVGSMSVKVNGYGDSPSGTADVRNIPIHTKTAEEVP